MYVYTVTYHKTDGTIDEYEIQSERNVDLSKDMSYLENIISQFDKHQMANEKDFDYISRSLQEEARSYELIVQNHRKNEQRTKHLNKEMVDSLSFSKYAGFPQGDSKVHQSWMQY